MLEKFTRSLDMVTASIVVAAKGSAGKAKSQHTSRKSKYEFIKFLLMILCQHRCGFNEDSVPGIENGLDSNAQPYLFRKRYLSNRNRWPGTCQIGQLTGYGHRQMKAVGSIFRDAYMGPGKKGLLDPRVDPDEIFVRSTDFTRTVMSAESFIQGLYELDFSGRARGLIDINTMDEDHENMVASTDVCPGLGLQYWQATLTPEFLQNYFATFSLLAQIAPVLQVPIQDINLEHVADCWSVSLCQDWTTPDELTPELFSQLEDTFLFTYRSLLQYPDRVQGTRQSGGPLLLEVYNRLKGMIDGEQGAKKFSLFSGHDVGMLKR